MNSQDSLSHQNTKKRSRAQSYNGRKYIQEKQEEKGKGKAHHRFVKTSQITPEQARMFF